MTANNRGYSEVLFQASVEREEEGRPHVHHDLLADILDADKRPGCLLNRFIVDFVVLDTVIIIRHSLVGIPVPILCLHA